MRIAIAIAVLISLTAPRVAGAQEVAADEADDTDERARQLYLQGDAAYEAGRYEVAITLWREAYGLSARPLLLYDLANAYERLGRLVEAADALEAYLPDALADERDAIASRLARLRERARVAVEIEEPIAAPAPPTPVPAPDAEPPLAPILLFAGAGVASILGVTLAALALDADARAAARCRDGPSGRVCLEDARAPLGDAASLAIGADVSLALGLALAAGGAIATIVFATDGAHERAMVRVSPRDVALRVTFF